MKEEKIDFKKTSKLKNFDSDQKNKIVNFSDIEKKWQDKWEKKKVFEVKEYSKKKKYYVLEQFPYPSGAGLHIGHSFAYTIGDIYARFKRMQGFNLLHPIGFDALGLPAENAAIKAGIHPEDYTDKSTKYFLEQMKKLGFSYDWSRLIYTTDPEYYKWDQWIFLKMFEKGLAYRKKSSVNWCPKCKTVLANEQVHDGKCEYHGNTNVEIKHLDQWYLKITDYNEELANFETVKQWPDLIKKLQKNWIGKSYGSEINFEIPTNLNFIQLHGFTANPNEDFHPWLTEELKNRGYKVSTPKLPNTDNPNIMEQVEYVLKNCKFDENTVLLGHSLGCVVALKVVEQLDKPIKKLILTAGFAQPKFKDKQRPFEKKFDWKFDFNKIKNNVKEILLLRDENDSAVPAERTDYLKEKIGGEIIDFKAAEDHICGKEEPVVLDNCLEKWPIFTTRPDTIYGVTFMVVSAQHPKLMELVTDKQKKEVENFLKKIKSVSEKEMEELEKEGIFTGSYAINPINNEKVPVYAGNFVLADYGCGMVMAVPAHDQRDFEFAKKYNIPIKEVIKGGNIKEHAYTEKGILINSDKFNNMDNEKAKEEITKFLEKKKLGKKTINFRLRDWLVSRQRYWGTPIPIIYCEKCGIVPVPEKDLPIKLPRNVKFGEGNPLATNKDFVNTKCPKCKGKAKRETDTMDTFVNSSWYFLRYCDPKNKREIFDKKKANYWIPIDIYVGGKEHACMHDIYMRFYTKFLRDLGLLKIDEPAIKLFVQGIVHGEDGNKMSKSLGNVVDPMGVIKDYNADSLRLFLVSNASPESDFNWSDTGIQGSYRFVRKVFENFGKIKSGSSSEKLQSKLNKAIKEITQDIEDLKYNLAVIKLRSLLESFENEKEVSKRDLESFLKLLSVFCPHIAEELWSKLGNKPFISLADWPKADEKKISKKFEEQDKAVEKLKEDINNIKKIIEGRGEKKEKVYVYVLPKELELYKDAGIENVKIFSVADKSKYDPTNKSKNAKPGKPAIYFE